VTAIRHDDRAYRRGVVFGFTVAEVVLLLVFCLLLLFVPLLLGEASKAPSNPTVTPPYIELPRPAPQPEDGDVSTTKASRPPAPRTEPTAFPRDGAKPEDPPLGDPSSSPNLAPRSDPLPEGWVRVAPNAATSSATQGKNAPMARDGQPASPADAPFEALRLASLCDRLAIPAADCTATAVNEKLSALGRHDWPPIITLKEADGEFFPVGSALVSPTFEAKIQRDMVPRILDLAKRFQTDVVEIVGNTDEQPIPPGVPSNLDTLSFDVIAKGEASARLSAADNAGLGFARALAVVQVLIKDDRLKNLKILPLSAAQMTDVDGRLSNGSKGGDVKERRRIEIRVRQSAGTK
jgi:flagellar motor protein MotB